MGTQQLLVVGVAMVVIGVALAVAITMFQAQAIESSRAYLIQDLLYFANKARAYYWRPASQGGGNKNFTGLMLRTISSMEENENGRYYVVDNSSPHKIVIGGKGRVVVDMDTVEVQMEINEEDNVIRIIH